MKITRRQKKSFEKKTRRRKKKINFLIVKFHEEQKMEAEKKIEFNVLE